MPKSLFINYFIIFLMFTSFELSSCGNQSKKEQKQLKEGPFITLKKKRTNLGLIAKGTPLYHNISVFNEGGQPLLISKVRTNCGCTIASFDKTPILPGDSGIISLKLDTEHPGQFNKVVAIYSNAVNEVDTAINSSRVIFHIRWEVSDKKENKDIK